ncbi:hypothetical protein TL16_g06805 [Triparma laevis f. inornata]|uniref:RING-type domain-containing protein n=1 Tax=Triparma laevis f. inornata TaxID=1714386 RepID=A0A9W7ANP0_9STRA|nr:hypothetical protein TL16_g06805 [Triparma laevis f. inornata]
MCCVCMANDPSAKIMPRGHTVACRDCTKKLMKLRDPCPFCRRQIQGYELGKWTSSTGAAGLWPALLKNLSELASGEGFNDYFRDLFNGNEASWRRWKEVFDVLGIAKGGGGSIETQVLGITNSEDLVKLRALAKLCSKEYFADPSLLVVAWRRIMEVLDVEEEVGGEKGEKEERSARALGILDACKALGYACNSVGDFEDARRYSKRAKDGYEEQLGREIEKALEGTYFLILSSNMTRDDYIEKLKALVKRMEKSLGEENVVTLDTLNQLGINLHKNGEVEEAKEVLERSLAGRMKVLGVDLKDNVNDGG